VRVKVKVKVRVKLKGKGKGKGKVRVQVKGKGKVEMEAEARANHRAPWGRSRPEERKAQNRASTKLWTLALPPLTKIQCLVPGVG
jgi:hypothetical protein